jgi:EAL domain-containing protein (putative c-di-GMP-specific phosphodiesterase class I)/CheY-like chemotaxis protein
MQGFIPFGSKAYFQNTQKGGLGTVHIVDDLAEGLHFVASVLDQAGYHAELHASFADFASSFQRTNATAILLDIRLGREDATDVLEYLRREGPSVPIYLVSGDPDALASAKRFAEEIDLSITECLSKPFTGKQVLERLQHKTTALDEVFERVDVADSIQRGWIYPVLQPKLDLASGKIRSAELLSRMSHPDFGIVPPQRFVGHMNVDQSQVLLMQNIAYIRRHFEFDPRRGNDFPISVNVDVTNLVQVRENLREISARAPYLFRNLVFEITEEATAKITDEQLKALYKLNLDGARISIDDFGTGQSNFARLARLPFSEIKIDRSIVNGCSKARSRDVVIKSIISMAHDLGARVVAEGVEVVDDLQCVRDAGCDEVQGYLVGRPMKLEKFQAFATDFNGRTPETAPARGH